MSDIFSEPIVTPAEGVIEVLSEHIDIPIVTKIPRVKPSVFILVDVSVPENTATVLDRTSIFIKVYSKQLEENLSYLGAIRRIMWSAQGSTVLGWLEQFGPHETNDPDLDEWRVWQIGGYLFQSVR